MQDFFHQQYHSLIIHWFVGSRFFIPNCRLGCRFSWECSDRRKNRHRFIQAKVIFSRKKYIKTQSLLWKNAWIYRMNLEKKMCDILIALADNHFCLGTFYRLFMKSELGRERMLALYEHSKCVGQSNQYQCCISWKSCHLLEDLSYPLGATQAPYRKECLVAWAWWAGGAACDLWA